MEALLEKLTLTELSKKYDVHPNQITKWEPQLLEHGSSVFKGSNIAISMDSRGRALDDIYIERLWRSVKQEYVYLNPCDTGDELWRGLNDYFRFYNEERLHQSLGYRTPASFYTPHKEAA